MRRPIGMRNNVRYQIPTVKHGGGNVLVWSVFSAYGVGPLVNIDGTMNPAIDKNILEKNLLPYARRKMPKNWIFQHDNDPKHTSKLIKSWLLTKNCRF